MMNGETQNYQALYLDDLANRLRVARRPLISALIDREAVEGELEKLSPEDRLTVEQLLKEQ